MITALSLWLELMSKLSPYNILRQVLMNFIFGIIKAIVTMGS